MDSHMCMLHEIYDADHRNSKKTKGKKFQFFKIYKIY